MLDSLGLEGLHKCVSGAHEAMVARLQSPAGRGLSLGDGLRLRRGRTSRSRSARSRLDDAVPVVGDRLQHRADQLVAQQGGLEAEVQQLVVRRVVVVLLELDARVVVVVDLDLEVELGRARP